MIDAILEQIDTKFIIFITATMILSGISNLMVKNWEVLKRKEILNRGFDVNMNDILNEFRYKPLQFEHYIASVFECLGYETKVTKASGDEGKDIIMWKDKEKYVVEVKFRTSDKITTQDVQKFHSAIVLEDAIKGFYVTTSDFTCKVPNLAQRCNVELVNGDKLLDLIEKAISNKNANIDKLDEVIGIFKKIELHKN